MGNDGQREKMNFLLHRIAIIGFNETYSYLAYANISPLNRFYGALRFTRSVLTSVEVGTDEIDTFYINLARNHFYSTFNNSFCFALLMALNFVRISSADHHFDSRTSKSLSLIMMKSKPKCHVDHKFWFLVVMHWSQHEFQCNAFLWLTEIPIWLFWLRWFETFVRIVHDL